jgi:hypothetical protein
MARISVQIMLFVMLYPPIMFYFQDMVTAVYRLSFPHYIGTTDTGKVENFHKHARNHSEIGAWVIKLLPAISVTAVSP